MLYICFSLLRQDTVATITIWAEVGGFRRVVAAAASATSNRGGEQLKEVEEEERPDGKVQTCSSTSLQLEFAA